MVIFSNHGKFVTTSSAVTVWISWKISYETKTQSLAKCDKNNRKKNIYIYIF